MTRSRPLHIGTFGLFLVLLVSPWIAGFFGATSDTVERRAATTRPSLRGGALLDVETFAGMNDWVRDATPLRGDATGWVNGAWLALGVSAKSNVMEGPGDTLFLAEDFTQPCARPFELDDMVQQFAGFDQAARDGEKEWLFLVAPDKGAVLDHRIDDRAELAAACSRQSRRAFRAALDETGTSFDLAPTLIAADQREPGRWYYEHDSHWTFDAGGLVAEQIVDHFEPGLFAPSQLGTINRSLPIRGDIYARLGILKLRDEPDPVQSSLRVDVTTDRSEVQIGGTRTVRTYVSSGVGGVIPGKTIIVHDSMMNFAERQLASYFEQVEFIHWDDLAKADFFDRVAASERVIMVRVERNINSAMTEALLDEDFAARLTGALRTLKDADLGMELQQAADGMRRFTQDTGVFAQSFNELIVDPGIVGWTGPYLTGELFGSGMHPRYGSWRAELGVDSAGVSSCATIENVPCATWLVLSDVPVSVISDLDAEFDGGDGFDVGRVRRNDADGALYFYSFSLDN